MGDDVAIEKGQLLTTDSIIEGVHFTPSFFSYEEIGYKALASALSDIAACGGKPLWYLLNLGLRSDDSLGDVKLLIQGMEELEDKYSLKLIGGDTFHSPVLFLSITVGGESDNPVSRSGAKSSDLIYITGNIGGSKMGLYALENKIDSPIKKYHLRPGIRCEEGLYLNSNYNITSMIDISDGFLIDSNHLADESKKGLNIESAKIPICPECMDFAKQNSLDLMETVLTSGEEFELLFTSPDDIQEDFVSLIGSVLEGEGVYIDGKITPPRGYRHF